jgi:hypothetical protein
VLDYGQDVEQSKRCCDDNTKIAGHNGRGVVANKGRLTLIATGPSRRALRHVLSYRTGRYANPEFE